MKILITGAAGFLGQAVTEALLAESSEIHNLVLTDVVDIPTLIEPGQHRVKTVRADLNDDISDMVSSDLDAAILFHGIMSAGAEADFDLGYKVNVEATRALLDQLVRVCPGVRVLYASSVAVYYGRPIFPERRITEDDLPTPELSYGCQKFMCEMLINDYTRRGKINGFSLRFPTVSVRPGKPSPAVTAFLSGIIREPMSGIECVIPVKDRQWRHWTSSPRTTVRNILVALRLPRDALPTHWRAINMPGFAVTVQEMLDALELVGGKEKLALVREEEDLEGKHVLELLTNVFDNSLGVSLGMKQDSSFVQSVRDYAESMPHAQARQ